MTARHQDFGSSRTRFSGRSFRVLVSLIIVHALSLIVATFAQSDTRLQKLEAAAALISTNRIAEAEKELQAILKLAPNDSGALNLLGTVRAQQGRYPEAEALFIRAVRSDKLFVGPHLNLAHLYTLNGKREKAIVEFKEVMRLEPQNTEALDPLARLLLAGGQIDEGIKVLNEGEQTQQLSASLLLLRADAYLKKGDIAKAEENYQHVLSLDSENTDAVLGVAQVAQLKGDADAANTLLGRARKMVANSPDTLYRFAIVAMQAGLYEEANGTLQAAIRMKSDDASYFLALGTTWIKKPDLAEAEAAFRRALHLDPNNAQGQMYLGYTLLEQKKFPEARVWLQKSLDQNKTIPETFFYLGQISQEQNEDLQAIDLFKKAIQLVPTYSFAHAALGASYLRMKNYPAAQQELELSIKLNPNDAKAHYSLAVLFARINNQQRAQEEMAIVEQLKKTSQPAKTP